MTPHACEIIHEGQQARLVGAEIFDHALHGGEQDQQIGREQAGHERGQPVVVAELQLGVGDRVVFVDHRDDAAFEQGEKRLPGVQVPFLVFEIVVGEQHLRDADAVRAQQPVIGGHQLHLPGGGAGLETFQGLGSPGETQHAHAGADRAGADQHDLEAAGVQAGKLGDQLLQLRGVHPVGGIGEDAGAQLDHHAPDVFEKLLAHRQRGGNLESGVKRRKPFAAPAGRRNGHCTRVFRLPNLAP